MTVSDHRVRAAVSRLHNATPAELHALAEVLIDCVQGGASVSFMHPLALDKALAFWRGVLEGVARGERALLIAQDGARIVGTVQLVLGQPENQPHRADLSKMLVHRSARRWGVGAMLVQAAEQVARECGKSLLVLDTASADAARLYARHGWVSCGTVPGYALLPHGGLCATTFFYRELGGVWGRAQATSKLAV
jgi:GNAT superfamily N-acetyltransferase